MPHASDPVPGLRRIIHIGHEVSAGCGGDVEPRHDDDLTIASFTLYVCLVGLTKTRRGKSLRIPSVDTTKRRFCCRFSADSTNRKNPLFYRLHKCGCAEVILASEIRREGEAEGNACRNVSRGPHIYAL